jgi:hypothetical protein
MYVAICAIIKMYWCFVHSWKVDAFGSYWHSIPKLKHKLMHVCCPWEVTNPWTDPPLRSRDDPIRPQYSTHLSQDVALVAVAVAAAVVPASAATQKRLAKVQISFVIKTRIANCNGIRVAIPTISAKWGSMHGAQSKWVAHTWCMYFVMRKVIAKGICWCLRFHAASQNHLKDIGGVENKRNWVWLD